MKDGWRGIRTCGYLLDNRRVHLPRPGRYTHQTVDDRAPARCPDDTLRHRRNTLTRTNVHDRAAAMRRQGACAPLLRGRRRRRRRDGWIRNANDRTKTFIFIYLWMAGDRASRASSRGVVECRTRARKKEGGRARHAFIRARLHPLFRDGCSDDGRMMKNNLFVFIPSSCVPYPSSLVRHPSFVRSFQEGSPSRSSGVTQRATGRHPSMRRLRSGPLWFRRHPSSVRSLFFFYIVLHMGIIYPSVHSIFLISVFFFGMPPHPTWMR